MIPTGAEDLRQWYAVRTYSHREKVVAESLGPRGIHHFLPLIPERRRWSDRLKTVEVPLFMNYLFVKMMPTHEMIWEILNTRGVTQLLGNDSGPLAIPDKEILAVMRTLEAKTPLEIKHGLQAGQHVRVKSGPLQGIEGDFIRIQGKDRLALHVTLLGQTVLTEVNVCDIETC